MFISWCTDYYLTPGVNLWKKGPADQHQTASFPNRRDKMQFRHDFVWTFPVKELFTVKAQKFPVFHEGLKDSDYSKLPLSEKCFLIFYFQRRIQLPLMNKKLNP
jgi:hypothetical protein